MKHPQYPARPFRSAKEETKKRLSHEQMEKRRSRSFQLAFSDNEFLLRKELRPIRLQLELLKPELYLHDEEIESTVVFFGSARIFDAETAQQHVTEIANKLRRHPDDLTLQKQLKTAESLAIKSLYYDEARKLARIISQNCQHNGERSFVVVTGGGPGIMEAANRGAYDVNAKNIALNIVLPQEQEPNPYITPELCFRFHYFAIRKMHFLIRARALVAFPGGYGTMDELFEALTLLQTGKMKQIPILLFGRSYWSKIINFDALVDEGTINPEDLLLFQYVETHQEAWQAIADFYKLKTVEEG